MSLYWDIKSSIVFFTSFWEHISPFTNTLVESQCKLSIPSFPISWNLSESTLSPNSGVSSIFQSPVWNTGPFGVLIYKPQSPSIECDKEIN